MDETDLILSKLLLFNSRTPYRSLADTLGLSVNAVHKRIRSMVEERVIRGFTTKVSLSSIGAFHILIHGRSEADSTFTVLDDLGNYESVYWVTSQVVTMSMWELISGESGTPKSCRVRRRSWEDT